MSYSGKQPKMTSAGLPLSWANSIAPFLRDTLAAVKGRVALGLMLGNYLQALIGFSINVWLANRMGPEQYGILSYALVVGTFISTVVGFASDKTLVRDLVQSEDATAVLTASMVLRLGITILTTIGIMLWVFLDASIGNKFWPIILCSIVAMLFSLTPIAWFDSKYQMHTHAGITLGEKGLYGILLLFSYVWFPLNSVIAASCLLFSSISSWTIQWRYTFKSYYFNFNKLKSVIQWLLRENSPILLAALASLLLTHVNQLVLAQKRTIKELAFYAVAFQIASFVQIFQSQISRLLDPKISQLTSPGVPGRLIRDSLLKLSLLSLVCSAVIIVPIMALAPWIIGMFFRPDYLAAVAPLRMLCAWTLIYGPSMVISRFLIGFRLNLLYFCFVSIAGLVALGLGQYLVDIWGGVGVAMATFISHTMLMSFYFLAVIWRIKLKMKEEISRQ